MAKMATCPVCGREMKKGLLSSDSKMLDLGDKMVTICCDCYTKYEKDESRHAKRFGTKIRNYKISSKIKKITDEELIKMYIAYVEQAEAHDAEGYQPGEISSVSSIKFSQDGRFSIEERANDLLDRPVNAREMVKFASRSLEAPENWFTKDDITKIEYFPNGGGSFDGMFMKYYSYGVRFNDEKEVTFSPAITHVTVFGKSVMVGYRKKAEEQLRAYLILLRDAIGSDLPIVRADK